MFLILCLAISLQQIAADCPPFWTQFQTNCYRFFGAKKDWNEAELHCNSFSPAKHFEWATVAHLTSINSQAEQDFLYAYWESSREINDVSSSCWIGFKITGDNGDFTWSDESPVTYTNWDFQRPNDALGGNEKCTEMWEQVYGHKPKSWNDTPCDQQNHASFICKLTVT